MRVETEWTSCLQHAMAERERVEIEPVGIAVSALGPPIIGEIG